jgi:hypothetical protein
VTSIAEGCVRPESTNSLFTVANMPSFSLEDSSWKSSSSPTIAMEQFSEDNGFELAASLMVFSEIDLPRERTACKIKSSLDNSANDSKCFSKYVLADCDLSPSA